MKQHISVGYEQSFVTLWLDEPCGAELDGENTQRLSLPADCHFLCRSHCAAVQYKFFAEKSSYALLGYHFVPKDQSLLEIAVNSIQHYDSSDYHDKELSKLSYGNVCKGIHEYYVPYIFLETLKPLVAQQKLPGGELILDVGAHCSVSSSPLMFGFTAAKLMLVFLAVCKGRESDFTDCLTKAIPPVFPSPTALGW